MALGRSTVKNFANTLDCLTTLWLADGQIPFTGTCRRFGCPADDEPRAAAGCTMVFVYWMTTNLGLQINQSSTEAAGNENRCQCASSRWGSVGCGGKFVHTGQCWKMNEWIFRWRFITFCLVKCVSGSVCPRVNWSGLFFLVLCLVAIRRGDALAHGGDLSEMGVFDRKRFFALDCLIFKIQFTRESRNEWIVR